MLYSEEEEISTFQGFLGPHATVFQAECIGLTKAAKHTLEQGLTGRVIFLSDSQALLLELKRSETSSYLVRDAKETLSSLGWRNEVCIRWIRAHMGHKGNERADELAKEGALTPSPGCEPRVPLSLALVKQTISRQTNTTWNNRWKVGKDARQTIIFFPEIDLKKSRDLV